MKKSSQRVADLLEEMITVRLEELIKSDWFEMLVEQTVIKVLKEREDFEKGKYKYQVED
tara:strand:+ start:2030 stop:2206 length:177 start_codon:yes stop_codon:yes gene_type:complete